MLQMRIQKMFFSMFFQIRISLQAQHIGVAPRRLRRCGMPGVPLPHAQESRWKEGGWRELPLLERMSSSDYQEQQMKF